jgi:transposase
MEAVGEWYREVSQVSDFHNPHEELAMKTKSIKVHTKRAQAHGLILAIDLGKYKSVACIYEPAEPSWQVTRFTTNREELVKVLDKHQPSVVVIEACALCGWVRDLCEERGVACKVANTSSEAWKFKHSKRKTDKDDALRLAQLEALGQLPTVVIPPKAIREWRALMAFRQTLVGRRVAVQNRIRSILVGQGLTAPRGRRAWSAVGLQGISQLARPLVECGAEDLWRGMLDLALTDYRHFSALEAQAERRLDALGAAHADVQRLQTIGGVGPRTAEAVVAYLHEPKRFRTGKQVSAYAGMVPRQYQSGETDRRGRISKRGPGLLRKLLVQCAWCMLRNNSWARAVWQRLTRGRKGRRKQALVALGRKLLVRCWAMLRDGTCWRDDTPAEPAATPA